MNLTVPRSSTRGLAALRRLAEPRPAVERCELCAAVVSEEHQHLVDPEKRRILCCCDACAVLFDQAGRTQYRRVPRDIRELAGLEIENALWNSLGIPIGLVFFLRSSVSKTVAAIYPSPGGPAETIVEPELWEEIASLHVSLQTLGDDVEALLANRVSGVREYFLVPIDECYKLTGLIRRHWQGFSGGDPVWTEIRTFFEALKQRAIPERSARHV